VLPLVETYTFLFLRCSVILFESLFLKYAVTIEDLLLSIGEVITADWERRPSTRISANSLLYLKLIQLQFD